MVKTTIEVEGMACGMCEAHVKDALRKIVPKGKISASAPKHQAVIIAEDAVTEEQAHQALDPTGYGVEGVSSEPYEKKKRGLFGRKK